MDPVHLQSGVPRGTSVLRKFKPTTLSHIEFLTSTKMMRRVSVVLQIKQKTIMSTQTEHPHCPLSALCVETKDVGVVRYGILHSVCNAKA